MNIRWDQLEKRFVAEFSSDFQGDLSAVKAAGFKTDGPPNWIWYATKVATLNKLRIDCRPVSGLTIDNDALAIYAPLNQIEEKNAEIKHQISEERKRLAKEKQLAERDTCDWLPEGKEYLDASDFPSREPFLSTICSAPYQGPLCVVCHGPIELPHDPPICLWCAKELDTQPLT